MKSLKKIIFAFLMSFILTVSGAAGTLADNWQKEPPPRKPPERPTEKDKRDEPRRDDKKKPNNYF